MDSFLKPLNYLVQMFAKKLPGEGEPPEVLDLEVAQHRGKDPRCLTHLYRKQFNDVGTTWK